MAKLTYRRCSNCGTINIDKDYCGQCEALININLLRQQAREAQKIQQQAEKDLQPPNRVTLFFEKALAHPNILIRVVTRVLYSIWVIVMAVGAFIAFLLSYIAA